jgi:hypothetical protein
MTTLVISIITLCLCVFSFFFFRWYIGRKTAARELLADYRAETYRLIAEIDAAADRDSLLVEERIRTLKKLLDDTDRRIAVYMRELQRSRAGEQMYTSLGRGIRAALDSRPETEATSVLAATLSALTPKETAPTPKGTLENATADTAAAKRKPKKAKLKTQIAELSAQGLSPAKIASRLKLSLAEVDLALNLLPSPKDRPTDSQP